MEREREFDGWRGRESSMGGEGGDRRENLTVEREREFDGWRGRESLMGGEGERVRWVEREVTEERV